MSAQISFRQLTSANDPAFKTVCDWQYGWWGEEFALTPDQVTLYMLHSICLDRVPYTYLEYLNETLIGYYQVIPNDLFTRPDLTPWFGFAFIAPEHRGHGYFRELMRAVPVHAAAHGVAQLFLHSRHEGLYEKFGWELLETRNDYKPDGITRRLYCLQIAQKVV